MGFLTAIGNVASTILTNKANAKQAGLNRDFQAEMSNTAHQREVEDLKKAGLNPILSAGGGGSSTPSGSQATMQAPEIDPMLEENLSNARAQRDNVKADTGLKSANEKSAIENIKTQKETQKLLKAQSAKEGQQARQAKTSADLADRYGEAQQVMGLVGSGVNTLTNASSATKIIKNLFNPANLKKGQILLDGKSGEILQEK